MGNPEIGRKLRPADLKPRQIVAIVPPGRGVTITMWVTHVDRRHVAFTAYGHPAGQVWTVVNFIRDDGIIVDDQGRQVWVFEYRGEP